MASAVGGQDESNPVLWLASRAGQMELSCPLGTTHRVPQEKFPQKPYIKSFIDQACSVEMAGYWRRSFFFCEFIYTQNTHKPCQYPAILTSHLVNNLWAIYLSPAAPCIRRLSPQYMRQSKIRCPTETTRKQPSSSPLAKIKTMVKLLWPLLISN